MELQLDIEPNQRSTMHRSLLAMLELAARQPDIDKALDVVRTNVNADFWVCGRGGGHVWLSLVTPYGPQRCATITEKR